MMERNYAPNGAKQGPTKNQEGKFKNFVKFCIPQSIKGQLRRCLTFRGWANFFSSFFLIEILIQNYNYNYVIYYDVLFGNSFKKN